MKPPTDNPRAVMDWMVRSEDLRHLIDVPRIIVVGDQSSGKSSVLECISSIRFPTKDILCTRFPVEILLKRSDVEQDSIQIIPSPEGRSADELAELRSFTCDLDPLQHMDKIIELAIHAMGLDGGQRRFGRDVLSISVARPDLPNLILVDLPGMFHSAGQGQTGEDALFVRDLVVGYMRRPRTVILAVITAQSEACLQVVMKYAKEEDPHGERTLGVVTKPDTLVGSPNKQQQFIDLVNNNDIPLRLGYHLLMNRNETNKHTSSEQRNQSEADFFQQDPWSQVPPDRKGARAFLLRLDQVVDEQIAAAIPSMLQDLELQIDDISQELQQLAGFSAKEGVKPQLSSIGDLISRATEGRYNHDFFRVYGVAKPPYYRLREYVEKLLADWAQELRNNGHAWELVEAKEPSSTVGDANRINADSSVSRPPRVQRSTLVNRILPQVKTSGKAGHFDAWMAAEMFYEKASRWPKILQKFFDAVEKAIQECLSAILHVTVKNDVARDKINILLVEPARREISLALKRLHQDKMGPIEGKRPITFSNEVLGKFDLDFDQEWERIVDGVFDPYLGGDANTATHEQHFTSNSVFDLSDLRRALLDRRGIYNFTCSGLITSVEAHYTKEREKLILSLDLQSLYDSVIRYLVDSLSATRFESLTTEEATYLTAEDEKVLGKRELLLRKTQLLRECCDKLTSCQQRSEADSNGTVDSVSTTSLPKSTRAHKTTQVVAKMQNRDGKRKSQHLDDESQSRTNLRRRLE